MNELSFEYLPETYHISQTHSVYVRLENSSLRLSHPRGRVPKRASYSDSNQLPVFINHRHFDIKGCPVKLLPEGLYKSR